MILSNKSSNKKIISNLQVAKSFRQRLVGLMGKSKLPEQYGLWIKKCNWVHTNFMKLSIDVIFIDKKKVVKKIIWNMQPWRFSPFVWSADSAIEIPTGRISKACVSEGDTLHVEP